MDRLRKLNQDLSLRETFGYNDIILLGCSLCMCLRASINVEYIKRINYKNNTQNCCVIIEL